ncbi:IS110 family RNA-guided transposase [Kingella kingae]|uniref:IS110 family transposase n=1 Tax=Kingella kingae TaxID=504 RepID=UPI0013DEB299|nr:IS110 family transposase [Kingella kingae]MBD3613176.1 IS110 family transposase [Kingella kingae]MBD3631534.1 IS110 family transposase [Kingella kingae]MBD3658842.1 IS110 family transposase [Kingella kingae]
MNVIALDISKSTADCFLKTSTKTATLKITNDIAGCLEIDKWIKQHRIRKLIIAMEATGIYYEKIANYLATKHDVTVINPLKIKEYGKSQFSRTKTDKADAKLIAEYASRHHDKLDIYQSPSDIQYELNKLISLQSQLNLQLHQEMNRKHASQTEFVKNAHQAIIDAITEQLELTQAEIAQLIAKQDKMNQQCKNLLSIPAIGDKTAPIILHYLTTRKFTNMNKFMAFAGLAPKIEQSGESVNKKCGLSRYGHKRLKAAFFYLALVAYNCNYFPQLVQNLQKANKPKMVIIEAIMRKLAKLCYCIHKSQKPFDKSRYQSKTA